MERTRGDKKTLVKSSNDCKLALHIGCAPNAKEYPRCCLPVISLLRTALAHAHARIQSLKLRESPSTRVELASTHIRMWVGFNPGLTRIHQKRVQCGHMQPEFNPSSTWVQVAVQILVKTATKVVQKWDIPFSVWGAVPSKTPCCFASTLLETSKFFFCLCPWPSIGACSHLVYIFRYST